MSFWTKDRVALLVKLWGDGLSASQCADRIGNCSRNAAISKIHRMGLTGRAQDLNRGRQGTRVRMAQLRKAKAANNSKPAPTGSTTFNAPPRAPAIESEPYQSTYVEINVPIGERKGLVDLEKDDCRWPIGDPRDSDFHFCNGKAVLGKPYCAHHINVAYRPEMPAQRQRANAHVEHIVKKETVDA